MPAPSYTWFPNIQLTPLGGGIQRISWDGFASLDAASHIPEDDFVLNSPVTEMHEADPGTRVDDVPLFPVATGPAAGISAIFEQPRWYGRGLYAYEITIDGVIVNRVAADHVPDAYAIGGCWNHYDVGGGVTGSTNTPFGPGDEFGNPCIANSDYTRNPYIDPPTHIDVPLDTALPHTIEIEGLYESVPPWVHWEVNGTVCAANNPINGTCQEALEGNYVRRKSFYPSSYPLTRKAGYVLPETAFGNNVPCTRSTCTTSLGFPGIFIVTNTIDRNQGERYRLAGTSIITEGVWVLDGAKGMPVF